MCYTISIFYLSLMLYRSTYTFAEPRVHALVYEPNIGLAHKLHVDFEQYIEDLRHVYDLYPVTDDNLKNGARYPGS